MTDLMYMIVGLIAGLVGGGMIVYLLPYRSLRNTNVNLQTELVDIQTRNNELQAGILEEQSKAYQVRQGMLMQQKRLEGELAQTHERITELGRAQADLEASQAQERQANTQEITQLRGIVERTEQEQIALQDRFAEESTRWDRERQSLLLDNTQLGDQVKALHQEKAAVNTQLEGQREAWERERLALQIQINTLEDNLTLSKARMNQGLPANSPQLVEQAKAEAGAELNRQRAMWEKEKQTLQNQLEQTQSERRKLEEQLAERNTVVSQALGQDGATVLAHQQEIWNKEKQELLSQLEQARSERQKLKESVAERDRNAERERGALEAEIEQLMERLLRLHRERAATD
ncbi:MAG: hypothetical protein U1F42_06690 [Candidatus Competibacteraceae bacterium]